MEYITNINNQKIPPYLLRIGLGKKTISNQEYKDILIENLLAWAQGQTSLRFIEYLAKIIVKQKQVESDKELRWAISQIILVTQPPASPEEVTDTFNAILQNITYHVQKISFPEIY